MIASIGAINKWLVKAKIKYNPIITAYNLAFDLDKCKKTNIDVSIFEEKFCLWYAAAERWGQTKKYRQFILDIHAFNPPTLLGNMSYKTSAEPMARFVLDQPDLADEPHTALEDVKEYELPILQKVVKKRSRQQLINSARGFNWRKYQVREHFVAK